MKHIDGAALLLAALGACSGPADDERPDILLVCIDTLRADHLSGYGYGRDTSPALDALARDSTVFLDASAAACWTKPSVPSFMTGLTPARHGVYEGSSEDGEGRASDVLPDAAVTLAEVLSAAGWRTGAFVKNAQLRRGQGIEQGFETYRDEAGDAREIRRLALDWIEAEDDGRPFFLYLHLLDAHWPYPVPDEFAERYAGAEEVARFRSGSWKELRDAIDDGTAPFGDADRAALVALYDGAIRFVDDELGILFDDLRARGLWSDAVVCVLSDHGEEFGEHGRIGHGHGLWEGLLRVPWILRVPGRAPARVAEPVSLLDLFPTLLAAAGVPAPACEGVDRLARPLEHRPILAEHKAPDRYSASLRDGRLKVLSSARALPRAAGAHELLPGRRVEVELELPAAGGDGGRALPIAHGVEDAGDEDGEPAELKGPLEAFDVGRVVVGGIELARSPDLELRLPEGDGDGGHEARRPRPGELVKARLEPDGAGGLRCTRLKLYPADAGMDFELRGTVQRCDPEAGLLVVAGIEVRLAPGWTLAGLGGERRALSRADVRALLAGGADVRARVELARETRIVDGLREDDVAPAAGHAELERELEHLGRAAAARALWSEADKSALTDADLAELRAIGYAE